MGRKAKRPELVVIRRFKGDVTMIDAFANAYRVYFDEMKTKSSVHTFDRSKLVSYNEGTLIDTEDNCNGTTA